MAARSIEPAIMMKGSDRVQVGIAEWKLKPNKPRYAVVGYSRGKKVVHYGDAPKKVLWEALSRQESGDMWIGALVDLFEVVVMAQSLTPDGPGYVESLSKYVEKGSKRSWQK